MYNGCRVCGEPSPYEQRDSRSMPPSRVSMGFPRSRGYPNLGDMGSMGDIPSLRPHQGYCGMGGGMDNIGLPCSQPGCSDFAGVCIGSMPSDHPQERYAGMRGIGGGIDDIVTGRPSFGYPGLRGTGRMGGMSSGPPLPRHPGMGGVMYMNSCA
jgi:hypothetical protein